jgi:hypothetical protein
MHRLTQLPLLDKLGLGCLTFMIILIGILSVVVIAGLGATRATPTPVVRATTVPPRPPTPTPTPTLTPTLTPTPAGPRLITAALFGGTEPAFTARYGAPTFSESNVRHYPFTASDGSHVVLVVVLDAVDPVASDGQPHVNRITVTAATASGSLNPTTTMSVVLALLPPDAQHTTDEQVPAIGTLHVYLSQDLAATFPAAAFTDLQTTHPLTPGTLSFFLGTKGAATLDLGA